jgi:tRNA-Thr(GGU) m(6)t(6)A37 methyltransferase TsaA
MIIEPIAIFHSPLTSKFGIPRQSGLASTLPGRIVFAPEYQRSEAVRGMEGFDYLWLIWEFSGNRGGEDGSSLTVRPPRLGGNERVGVFASRSPFRPNRLGLSCVRLDRIELTAHEGPVIHVFGADLMDGTPIYDIKPYIAYADAHPEARSGFVDDREWAPLQVTVPDAVASQFSATELQALREVLSHDPRPQFHHDPERVYGMPFAGRDVKFRVSDGVVFVLDASLS